MCSTSLARASQAVSRPAAAAGPVISDHWPLATGHCLNCLRALPYAGRRLAVASSRCISARPDIWQPRRHLSHSSTPHLDLEEAQKQLPVVVGQGPFLVFSASPFAVSFPLPFRLVCAGCCRCRCRRRCPRLPRFPCRLPRSTRQAAVHPTLSLHAWLSSCLVTLDPVASHRIASHRIESSLTSHGPRVCSVEINYRN